MMFHGKVEPSGFLAAHSPAVLSSCFMLLFASMECATCDVCVAR